MPARKVPITVYAEMTPNPDVMKFVANKVLNPGAPLDYSSSDDASGSPLAEAILNFPFVENVFISNNYVSVTKNDKIDWDMVVMETRNFISDYLRDGKEIVKEEGISVLLRAESVLLASPDTSITAKVAARIDAKIKPAAE